MTNKLIPILGALLTAALLVTLTAGAVCAGDAEEYQTFCGNYERNAVIPAAGPVNNTILWEKTASDFGGGWGDTTSTPVIHDGKVYVPKWMDTANGGVYCFDTLTGDLLCKNTGFNAGSLTISKNYLYATGTLKTDGTYSKGALYCLNLNNLTLVKNTTQIAKSANYVSFTTSPLVDTNGNIWVYVPQTPDGKTLLLGYTHGLTNADTPYTITLSNGYDKAKYVSPSINGNIIYVPDAGGISAYNISNPATPTKVGEFDAGISAEKSQMTGTPVYNNETLYFMTCEDYKNHTGKIYAIDVSSTPYTEKWNVSHEANYATTPIIYNGYLYALGYSGLYAYNLTTVASTKTHEWKQIPASGYPYRGSPLIAKNVLYYGTYQGTLYAVDLTTHKVLFTAGDGANCFDGQPAIADNILFLGNGGQKFYAIYTPDILYKGTVYTNPVTEQLTIRDVLNTAQDAGYITYNASESGWITDICGITDHSPDWWKGAWSYTYTYAGNVTIPNSINDPIPVGATLDFTYNTYNQTTFKVLKVQKEVILTVATTADATINLKQGWNFISVPKALEKPAAEEFLSPISKSGFTPMTWDAENEIWIPLSGDTKIVPLTGYWVYADIPTTLYVVYDKEVTTVPPIKHLYEGWNSVGVSGTNIMNASAAFENIDWGLAHVWNISSGRFDTTIRPSTKETPLPHFSGIWLYSNEEKGLPGYL